LGLSSTEHLGSTQLSVDPLSPFLKTLTNHCISPLGTAP
jgi:hypothetical protein